MSVERRCKPGFPHLNRYIYRLLTNATATRTYAKLVFLITSSSSDQKHGCPTRAFRRIFCLNSGFRRLSLKKKLRVNVSNVCSNICSRRCDVADVADINIVRQNYLECPWHGRAMGMARPSKAKVKTGFGLWLCLGM